MDTLTLQEIYRIVQELKEDFRRIEDYSHKRTHEMSQEVQNEMLKLGILTEKTNNFEAKLKEQNEDFETKFKEQNDDISNLKKFMWLTVGGVAVIEFLFKSVVK